MPRRLTKEKTHIRLPETQIKRIDALADSWSHETRAFMRARLNQYQPGYRVFKWMKAFFFATVLSAAEKQAHACVK